MTTRRYECEGYSVLLEADANGAWITLQEGAWSPTQAAIRLPWKVMAEICGIVSRWECSARTGAREIGPDGRVRETVTFE